MITYSIAPGKGKDTARTFNNIIVQSTCTNDRGVVLFEGTGRICCGTPKDDIFEFTNLYLATLSPERLEKHWAYLKQAKRIIAPGYFNEDETPELEKLRSNSLDYKIVRQEIKNIFIEMYDNLDIEKMSALAEHSGFLRIPDNLDAITSRGDYPEETTINEYKYKKLALLGLISRFTIPVTNQLISHFKSVLDNSSYSVFGDMLCSIPVIKNHEGYKVLKTYVNATLKRREKECKTSDIFSFSRRAENITNKGVLLRLALTHIPSKIPDKNISNEINSLVTGELKIKAGVKIKSVDEGTEKKSIQESYGIVQDVNSSDELATAEYFTFDLIYEESPGVYKKHTKDFFKYQCQGLDIKNQVMAEKIYLSIPKGKIFHLTRSHIKILQLVFAEQIPYEIYEALNYDQLCCALALAQVKLYEMGFEQLAIFIMSIQNKEDEKNRINEIIRFTAEEKEFLIDICGDSTLIKERAKNNPVLDSAEEFIKEVYSTEWITNIYEGVLGKSDYYRYLGLDTQQTILFNSLLKDEFFSLIKKVNS